MRRRIRDRLFLGAHFPGSAFWVLAATALVGAVVMAAVGDWGGALGGLFAAAVIVSVTLLLSRSLGWPFWPWR